MHLTVDLHSHSGASGGVGDIRLDHIAASMSQKGIGVFGSGDALHDGWLAHLDAVLTEAEPGLYALAGCPGPVRFLIQSELILTAPVATGGRKSVHLLVLLPSLRVARLACRLLDRWQVKRGIGRPFLVCDDRDAVAAKLHALQALDAGIELIPAHVLTPQGIYGSNHPVDCFADFFGDAAALLRVVETGLSADPEILALIPELDQRVMISNSDCHGGALNRLGREYTTLETSGVSYEHIISALRARRIVRTAEFAPAEGRYFLTGHRAGRRGHRDGRFCYFSPDTVPSDNQCPICAKPLTVGVLQRALELSSRQGQPRTLATITPRQQYVHVVPLIEVLAAGLGVQSITGKQLRAQYDKLLAVVKSEADFWALPASAAVAAVARALGHAGVVDAVQAVVSGQYCFEPIGFDGSYGKLVLGRRGHWFGHVQTSGGDTAG